MRKIYLLILMLLLLLTPVSAEKLVKVEILNTSSGYYESLTVLKPGSENWIKMTGGGEVSIPKIKLVYNGINSTQYTKGTKVINITTYGIKKYQDFVVNYPFTKHPMYYPEDNVTADILGTSDLASKTAYIYLVKTSPTQLKNDLDAAVDGNTQPLRNLLSSGINKSITLNASGDGSVAFGKLSPGDYVVVALLNKSSDANVTFISSTAFEVLESKSSLSADTTITRSSKDETKYLNGKFVVLNGSDTAKYTYVAAMIKKDAELTLKLTSNGTKATTNLTAKMGSATGEAELVKGYKIAGVGLKNVNSSTVKEWLKAFPSDTVGFSVDRGVTGKTYNFKILLKGLSDGEYYLYVAAWNSSNSSQRVVAFNWASVKISTVTPTPVSVGGGAGGGGMVIVPTPTPSPSPTPTPKTTPTPVITPSPKPTPAVTPTPKPTVTPAVTPTVTPTAKPTATLKPTPTHKPWWKIPGFEAVIAIAVLAVIAVWKRR